jgi:UTP--glucose-1-phosphate uridylyltransferase
MPIVPVRKAVIPAAGLGTRFLPASKAIPKEMIPVVDRPGIQYTVEEAARAGIRDILIVSSWGKGAMEDHFDRAVELEMRLERGGKDEELSEVRRISEIADVHSVRQKEPLGLGHAVLMAKEHVGNEPFAVLLPDEIVPEPIGDEVGLLGQMINTYEERNGSVVLVQEVPQDQISSYGVISGDMVGNDLYKIDEFVEKPAPEDAPSNLGSRGRYVLAPEIFDAIERTTPGWGGEIQVTDAIGILAREKEVFAYVYRGPMFDVGKKVDYLKATVELALRRADVGKQFREWLIEVAGRLES